MDEDRYPKKVYKMISASNTELVNWVNNVKNILEQNEFGSAWIRQGVIDKMTFFLKNFEEVLLF